MITKINIKLFLSAFQLYKQKKTTCSRLVVEPWYEPHFFEAPCFSHPSLAHPDPLPNASLRRAFGKGSGCARLERSEVGEVLEVLVELLQILPLYYWPAL